MIDWNKNVSDASAGEIAKVVFLGLLTGAVILAVALLA